MKRTIAILFLALVLTPISVLGTTPDPFTMEHMVDRFIIAPLRPSDRQKLETQRAVIDNLAREKLGRFLTGKKAADLEILQLLLDKRFIGKEQRWELQSLGVVLGDTLATEHQLKWVIYQDKGGRNRALQRIKGTSKDVIFPITMISRRVERGIAVDVQEIYAKAEKALKEIK